jgi:urease accessory protein
MDMPTATITPIPTLIPMAEDATEALRLFAWLSPGYPVGAYAYSHGLEAAVEAGDVTDEASLAEWLRDVCERGSLRNDLILVAQAHAAARSGEDLAALNDLALALAPSRELHLETSQQGRSFLDATLGAWPCPVLSAVARVLDGPVAYPVAVGAAAGAHGMAVGPVLGAYALAFVQNLVSAALRSAPVGQAAGTRVVAALVPYLTPVALAAREASLDDLGSACLRLDLGSFRHETQYSRIFRS